MFHRYITTENEIESRKEGNPGFDLVSSTNPSAFHANQSEDGAKEAQTDSRDHQSPAHLNVTCSAGDTNEATVKNDKQIKGHSMTYTSPSPIWICFTYTTQAPLAPLSLSHTTYCKENHRTQTQDQIILHYYSQWVSVFLMPMPRGMTRPLFCLLQSWRVKKHQV